MQVRRNKDYELLLGVNVFLCGHPVMNWQPVAYCLCFIFYLLYFFRSFSVFILPSVPSFLFCFLFCLFFSLTFPVFFIFFLLLIHFFVWCDTFTKGPWCFCHSISWNKPKALDGEKFAFIDVDDISSSSPSFSLPLSLSLHLSALHSQKQHFPQKGKDSNESFSGTQKQRKHSTACWRKEKDKVSSPVLILRWN